MAAEVIYIVPNFHISLQWLNQCSITLLTVPESVLHCYDGFTSSQSKKNYIFLCIFASILTAAMAVFITV